MILLTGRRPLPALENPVTPVRVVGASGANLALCAAVSRNLPCASSDLSSV